MFLQLQIIYTFVFGRLSYIDQSRARQAVGKDFRGPKKSTEDNFLDPFLEIQKF